MCCLRVLLLFRGSVLLYNLALPERQALFNIFFAIRSASSCSDKNNTTLTAFFIFARLVYSVQARLIAGQQKQDKTWSMAHHGMFFLNMREDGGECCTNVILATVAHLGSF